jgi:hypothetical protein
VPLHAPGRLSWALGLLVLGGAGCGSNLPTLTFPQLQAVGEIGEYGTDRVRVSNACRQSSASVDVYVQCMGDKGWKFIGRGNIYPAPECWSLRTAGDPRQMPTAQCFERSNAPAPNSNATTGAPSGTP